MVVTTRFGAGSSSGSGSGEGGQDGSAPPEVIGQMRMDELDARICDILHDEVAAMFRAELLELFGSIKTAMVEYFDERYVALAETAAAAAAAVGGGVGQGF